MPPYSPVTIVPDYVARTSSRTVPAASSPVPAATQSDGRSPSAPAYVPEFLPVRFTRIPGYEYALSAPTESAPVATPPVTGYAMWLAPESSIYSDTAGSTPAVSDGEVRYWQDLSGNGNHALFTLGGQNCNRGPRYGTATLNGKRLLRFGDAASYADANQGVRTGLITAGNVPLTGGITVFWVGYPFTVAPRENGGTWVGYNSIEFLMRDGQGVPGSAAGRFESYHNSSGAQLHYATPITDDVPRVFTFRFDDSLNEMRFFIGGTSVASQADAGATPASGRITVGYRQDDLLNSHAQAAVAELIAYSTPLSNANVSSVASYLAAKYSI